MVPHTVTLSLGRLFIGTTGGITNVVFGKMITETMPDSLISTLAMCHNVCICTGLLFSLALGSIVPESTANPQDLADDQLWRVIYGFPAIISTIEIVLIFTVFKLEPTAACVMNANEEAALAHLRKVYRKKDEADTATLDELLSEQLCEMRRSTNLDAQSTTFKQAVCGAKYRKATWVCVFLNLFNQQTGINAVTVYANRLLEQMA